MPLARAKAERALAIALRHGFQTLLRGADDGRQIHDNERQRTGQQGSAHVQKLAEEQHAHQTIDDRRDAGECFGCIFNDADHFFVLRIFGKIYCRADAQRKHNDKRGDDDIKRVEDVRQDADCVGKVARLCGKKLPCDIGQTLQQHIADEKQHQRTAERGGEPHQAAHKRDISLAFSGELLIH